MVEHLNQTFTCEGNEYVPTWKDILKACVITCVSLAIVIGNVFSAIVFNSSGSKKLFLKNVRLTMNSLICTDLSMGLFVCPFCIYSALYKCWPYSETFCKIQALMLFVLCQESILSLVLIALDRYFSVHYSLKYNSFMTSRKYVFIILTTWSVTFSTNTIIIFVGKQFHFNDKVINCEPNLENPYLTLPIIGIYNFIPILLFLYSYGSIFAAANRKETIRVRSRNARTSHNNHAVTQIIRTSKYLVAITTGLFVAVIPRNICKLVTALANIKLNDDISFAVTWLAISNKFWNVVIYCVMNRKFRQAAMSLTNRRRLHRFLQPHIFSRECDDQISVSRDQTCDCQAQTTCTELSNFEQVSVCQRRIHVSVTHDAAINTRSQHRDINSHNSSRA